MYEKYEELRDKKGVTDYRVCKETGIAPATLRGWRRGDYKPKFDKLTKLADYFGVPVGVFLGGGK